MKSAAEILSEKEMRLARLLAKGRLNKECCSTLGLALRTVELRRHQLFKKLGAITAFEAGVKWGRMFPEKEGE